MCFDVRDRGDGSETRVKMRQRGPKTCMRTHTNTHTHTVCFFQLEFPWKDTYFKTVYPFFIFLIKSHIQTVQHCVVLGEKKCEFLKEREGER